MAKVEWTEEQLARYRARKLGTTIKEVFAKSRPIAAVSVEKAANQAKWAENKQRETDAVNLLLSQLHDDAICTSVFEYQFDEERKWRFDFALLEPKIAVEIEGGIHQGGRHNRASGFIKDIEKYNAAAILGWRVLRFTYAMIKSGEAAETIRRALA